MNNVIIENRLLKSKNVIMDGNSISYGIKSANIFPNNFVTMIEIGEQSGNLEETLKSTNEFYTEELKQDIEKLSKIAEPVLILIMGIITGIFVLAMIIPMYDAISVI